MKYITEIKTIQVYNTFAPNGYNSTTGGEGGKEISEETRKRMSQSNKGRKFSEETKKENEPV